MNILFDTHTFLWFMEGKADPENTAGTHIRNLENTVYFSAASYWELCIKISIGKLHLKSNWRQTIDNVLVNNRITWLDIRKEHFHALIDLPRHHKDPFDRLLTAQAIMEGCLFYTADSTLSKYGVEILGE